MVEGNSRTFLEQTPATTEKYRACKRGSTGVLHAGAGEGGLVLGFTQGVAGVDAVRTGEVNLRLRNAGGTVLLEMAGACSKNDPIYCAADGRGTATPNGAPIAIAESDASGEGSIIEVMPTQGEQGYDGVEDIFLGVLDFSTVANGNNITGFVMPFAGAIEGFYGVVRQVCVGASGAIDLNLELEGTNVTGGVLPFSTADSNVRGEVQQASAITAANTFEAGDLLDVEGANAAGTRTSGLIELHLRVRRSL